MRLLVFLLLVGVCSCQKEEINPAILPQYRLTAPAPQISSYGAGAGVRDIDGNYYRTVVLGGKEWMRENLRTTRFNNGLPIYRLTNWPVWFNNSQPHARPSVAKESYCDINWQQSNRREMGVLYNLPVVESRSNVCPLGWHIPSTSEWDSLFIALGANITLSSGPYPAGYTDSSGTMVEKFVGRGAILYGSFYPNTSGWWSSDNVETRFSTPCPPAAGGPDYVAQSYLHHANTVLGPDCTTEPSGFAIRCIKN